MELYSATIKILRSIIIFINCNTILIIRIGLINSVLRKYLKIS
jgi:hypothetical protein